MLSLGEPETQHFPKNATSELEEPLAVGLPCRSRVQIWTELLLRALIAPQQQLATAQCSCPGVLQLETQV